MKWFWLLACVALIVLGGAAVWMGGLNQDEGWYLYAANLVAENRMPYRDFFFTQGPLLPMLYSSFTRIWQTWGLLGARVFTLTLGMVSIFFATLTAHRLAPDAHKHEAALITTLLLGCNLYHLYYLAIPKTYALASLFVSLGFYLVACVLTRTRFLALCAFSAGVCLAFAAGARISLGLLLAVVGTALLAMRRWKALVAFCFGGFGALALVYGPFLLDEGARRGLIAAQAYHAARGGFDITWLVGSFSRLVRWYLPIFIILGLGDFRRARLVLIGFLAVFAVQMCAPFPYEDYQVPLMVLLAVFAAVNVQVTRASLLALGLSFATSFGSPLLESWSTDGQDRFWSIKKDKTELAQLRDVARRIEAADPHGTTLLTQDTYLAIETNRKVPYGLEMGPFSMLTDDQWMKLLNSAPCTIAALSGYSFAVEPPVCNERPVARQVKMWKAVNRHYSVIDEEAHFGQNATHLRILKRK